MPVFALSSGATLQFSETARAWNVVSPDGVSVDAYEHPQAALLLLEQPPETSVPALPGFPFERVVEAGARSRLPRYRARAAAWLAALQAPTEAEGL